MKVQRVKVEDAVGMVIPHDMTKIEKGGFKGPCFRKGHVIQDKDVPELLSMGKSQIFVLDFEADDVHEDEAGVRLGSAAAGEGVTCSEPRESRVNLYANQRGLLKINVPALKEINRLPEVIFSTLTNNTPVLEGDLLAGTKVIPLAVKEEVVQSAEEICLKSGKIVEVVPYRPMDVGIVVTGAEVFSGRIQDKFGPVLQQKVEIYGSRLLSTDYAPDDPEVIAQKISAMVAAGAGMVLVSGGMSVDPDDVTPQGIRLSGAVVVKYGAPVLPGAMFMLAYHGDVPVIGIPACGMYFRITLLDLILPRIFAGERIDSDDIIEMAHGGLCRSCTECHFPRCSFGQGGR
ncbi:molybdopterin-binding protein [Heliobacterium chlorum]|uniref:Molybdopterin molybdenumtransferase n=1 Tax=Heliobacterium chlorum TaxID=2698 RepID=A0ABR7T228_HELCL|nr:molybdopterin-binding protein [Heliobacterium chlorum]MBC9783701.1 molybdopterin-binding protein [Heliobacterium chlorum]